MAPARTGVQLTRPSSRTTRILVALAVVGVLVGVLGLLLPRLAGDTGEDPARAEVVSRATDFAVTYNTYDVAEKADYQERMKGLLTPDYYREFARITDAVFSALSSKDQRSGDADVKSVAVDTLDGDSATALVAVDAAITTAADEAAVQRRFRWKVTFTRQGGEWRVSQFETVTPLDATAGEETPAPSPGASPSPSASQEDE